MIGAAVSRSSSSEQLPRGDAKDARIMGFDSKNAKAKTVFHYLIVARRHDTLHPTAARSSPVGPLRADYLSME